MMQPTPAPPSPPGSPEPVGEETVYPAPPQNRGSAPFSVLAGLFTKLSTERKPDRRRRLLNAWFSVCFISQLSCIKFDSRGIALEGASRLRPLPRSPPHPSSGMFPEYLRIEMNLKVCAERSRACSVWPEGEKSRQGLYQTHSTRDEGPRCSSTPELEETRWEIRLCLCESDKFYLRFVLGRNW